LSTYRKTSIPPAPVITIAFILLFLLLNKRSGILKNDDHRKARSAK